jgi:lysozyme
MTPNAIALAVALLKQVEGFRSAPYRDSGGTWTIGYGSIARADGSPITADTAPITIDQGVALMMPEVLAKAAAVDAMAPDGAPDCQCAACLSFTYNEGSGAFHGSTLARLWQAGDIEGAAGQFASWVYAGGRVVAGLVNRRKLERAVFLGLTAVEPMPQPADTADALDQQFNPGVSTWTSQP